MSSATASSSGSPPSSASDAHAMEAVLPVSATRDLELMEASAARVSPQQIGSLVRELNALRQHEIGHLKRVRRRDGELEVLLWAGAPDDYFGALPEPAQRALRAVGLPEAAHAVRVPRHAPATRAQFDAWNAVWPLTFHESACAHALAPWPPPPEPLERAKMAAHMRAAVELARRSAESGGRPVAALIVRRGDAADGAADGGELVLAACADGCCAPLLAGGGGGGGAGAACADGGAAGGGGGAASGGDGTSPLQHSLMRCIEEVARQQRDRDDRVHRGSKRPAERQGNDLGPHLCAGCDAYVVVEPCAMCAMALVHSRIRRVVYALPSADQGALGSRYRLHTERALNHHFAVYRGFLADEARAALGEPDGGAS